MDNRTVANRLAAHARELDRDGGNLYRSRAYRTAVQTILGLDQPIEEVVAQGGRKSLAALPGIGPHLAYTLERLVRTGEFRTMTPAKRRSQKLRTALTPQTGSSLEGPSCSGRPGTSSR
jgi:DNA polymerase/3'-5' exonuclease PolX